MSLLDALNNVKKENFDPSKGKTNSFDNIPDGTYNMVLDSVQHGSWPNSGTDYVSFAFKVLDGENAGRTEFIRPTLAETTSKGAPMPDFVLTQSIKTIQVIGSMVGLNVPDKCFAGETESDSYEAIAEEFLPYKGKTLIVNIKSSENKKDPDRPYRNYSFEPMQQPKAAPVKSDPFKETGKTVEVNDDDLPF